MADGGGINIRMSLKGAEQVRGELASIGPAGSAMARDLDRALRQPSSGMKALDDVVGSARGQVDGLAGRIGPLGSAMGGLGAVGLGAAAALAAVGIAGAKALTQAREAMTLAGQLMDASERLQVSTDALQEWRHVAVETGADASAADEAIAGFTKRLGEATIGLSKKAAKPFAALGLSPEDLRQFDSVESAMDEVVKRISNLSDEAQKAALTEKLGLGPLQNAVRRGGDEIERLRIQAQELGIVMDAELIRRADQADEKFDQLSRVIDIQLKSAFVDLAPAIVTAIGLIADLATALADVMDGWRQLDQKTSRGLQREASRISAENNALVQRYGSRDAMNGREADRETVVGSSGGAAGVGGAMMVRSMQPGARETFDNNQARLSEIFDLLKDRDAAAVPVQSGRPPSIDLSTAGGGGGVDRAAQESARRRREAARALDQLSREEAASAKDYVREVLGQAGTAEARADVALALLQIDEEQRAAKLKELEATLKAGGLADEEVAAKLKLIAAQEQDIRSARETDISERRKRDERDALAEAERAYSDIQAEILSLASASARTSDERRAIELSILEISQRRQKAELEAAIEAEKEPAARARLVAALDNLPTLQAAQRDRVERDNAGPYAAWRDAQMTGPQTQEWLQGEALDALDGVNKGLIDTYKNAESAGDALNRMGAVGVNALQQIADALLEVAIQQMFIQPLTNALFGGEKSGGSGGFLGNLMNNIMGSVGFGGKSGPAVAGDSGGLLPGALMKGQARGGLQGARGLVPVGEYGIELMDMPAGARIYDTERTERMLRDATTGGGGGASGGVTVSNNIRVINQTGEPVKAKMQQRSDGIDVVLSSIVDARVDARISQKGSDGSLNRALGQTPRGKTR
jgi:hypothetical protein